MISVPDAGVLDALYARRALEAFFETDIRIDGASSATHWFRRRRRRRSRIRIGCAHVRGVFRTGKAGLSGPIKAAIIGKRSSAFCTS